MIYLSMTAFREFLCSADESMRENTVSFGMLCLTRTGIIAFSLQAFLDDVVAAFTANRMTTEDQLVGADMQFMGLGSIPDGGE